jgi:probable F420-dependent oxidoreductase
LIAAMAAVTSRLRFLTNVYVLPLRNPFVVAKAVGTAAVVSGDRVALGIGMGWMAEEFALLEQPFRARGKRADEMLEVLRKLWTGETVEHRGEFYRFDPVRMLPAPRAPIPIYVGGTSEAALRRVARLGDGWVSDLHSIAELGGLIQRIRGLRAEYGRADEPLTVVASATDVFDLDGYRRLDEAGVTHLMTLPWLFYGGSTHSLTEKKDGIARFADDVIARLG